VPAKTPHLVFAGGQDKLDEQIGPPPLDPPNQRVTDQVVRIDTAGVRVKERSRRQPVEQRRNRATPDRALENLFGRVKHERGHSERAMVRRRRRAVDELRQQRLDHIGIVLQLAWSRDANGVAGQSERQRHATGQVHNLADALRIDPLALQIVARFGVGQLPQLDSLEQLAPPGVGGPGRTEALATGQDDAPGRRQRGENTLAQGALDRGQKLERVEQNQVRSIAAPGPEQRRTDRFGRGQDVPRVDPRDLPLALARESSEGPQKLGLADPAHSLHAQHPRAFAKKECVERRQLVCPPDEKSLAKPLELPFQCLHCLSLLGADDNSESHPSGRPGSPDRRRHRGRFRQRAASSHDPETQRMR